jgi:hypothetical protein
VKLIKTSQALQVAWLVENLEKEFKSALSIGINDLCELAIP